MADPPPLPSRQHSRKDSLFPPSGNDDDGPLRTMKRTVTCTRTLSLAREWI